MIDEESSSSYHPEKKQTNNCFFDGYSNWLQTSNGKLNNNQTIDYGQTSNWDWIPDESSSNWILDETTSNQFQAIDEKSTISQAQETEDDENPFLISGDPTTQSFWIKLRDDAFSCL